MLLEASFEAIPVPWILIDASGQELASGSGALFGIPIKAARESSKATALAAQAGWSVCPNGFAIFRASVPQSQFSLSLYGLRVRSIATFQGNVDEKAMIFDQETIESYVRQHFRAAAAAISQVNKIVLSNVHEIRGLNKDIKAANDWLIAQQYNDPTILKRLNNIKALSEILTARTDFLEYVSAPTIAEALHEEFRPYTKFEKTKRSLEQRANDNEVWLTITGNSLGYIRGLRIFEVVPFILIQNAIKYSPVKRTVTIRAADHVEAVSFAVESFGPALKREELGRVFRQGFRGTAAINTGAQGSGVGLFFAREIVERLHHGRIAFSQTGSPELIKNVPFVRTEVSIELPRIR